jgi:hypothetical protein
MILALQYIGVLLSLTVPDVCHSCLLSERTGGLNERQDDG